MSDTYTGTIDPALSLTLQSAQFFPENNDRQGTLVEISSLPGGASVDGIFYFNSSNPGKYLRRVIDGPIRAAYCGIYGNGTDQTTKLQAAFNHPDIYEIEFDYSEPVNITINSTLTIPTGKRMSFKNGNRFIGTGTITGGTIVASLDANLFATTLTLTNVGTQDGIFGAKWFGALGNGSADDYASLQKAIDYVVINGANVRTLMFVPGNYRITKGLLVLKDTNADGNPEQAVIKIAGFGTAYTGNGEVVITCSHSDNFALAIQEGKNCIVENMVFNGPNILNYSLATAWNPETTYLASGSIRSNSQSPFAGIVLDPFGSSTVGANRYPGFESYYAGVLGNGGSTDCKFRNISVNGFCVGIILTPNANTQNNEAHEFDGVWLANCRDGFVTTNSQERTVKCTNFKVWNSVHTVFRTNGYGIGRGEVPLIDNVNIAGGIYQIFNFYGIGGYFPKIDINNVYAELFYRIGFINGITVQFNGCHFSIGDPGLINMRYQDAIYGGSFTVFMNCIILTYTGINRVPYNMFGRIRFYNCYLHNEVSCGSQNWTEDLYQVQYENCRFYSQGGFVDPGTFSSTFSSYVAMTYGSQLELATTSKEYGTYSSTNSTHFYTSQTRRILSPLMRRVRIATNAVITVTGNSATFTIASLANITALNGLILYASLSIPNTGLGTSSGGAVMRIVSIDATGLVTCDRLIQSMVSGTYVLYVQMINQLNLVGFCDTNGTSLTNVTYESNTSPATLVVGGTYFINGHITFVTASSAGSATIYSNTPAGISERSIISMYNYEEFGTSYVNPLNNVFFANGVAFTKGSFYKNVLTGSGSTAGVTGWLCTKSGIKGSAIPPEFRAVYNNENNGVSITLNSNGSIAIDAGELVSYIIVIPANNLTTFKIGTTVGGGEIEPGVNLTAGTVYTWNPGRYFQAAGTLYFTNVLTGTQIIVRKA
jgi:hypothetical protein